MEQFYFSKQNKVIANSHRPEAGLQNLTGTQYYISAEIDTHVNQLVRHALRLDISFYICTLFSEKHTTAITACIISY